MAIDDNTLYGLTGAQVKELPGKINAVKGQPRFLTASDYNYPVSNPASVNPGMLAPGFYIAKDGTVNVFDGQTARANRENILFFISKTPSETNMHEMIVIDGNRGASNDSYKVAFFYTDTSTGTTSKRGGALGYGLLDGGFVANNLDSNASNRVLSAKQGKVLKDFIGDLTNLTTTDKTNLVAAINEAAASGGGSGPTVVQTTGTSTTDVMSQNAVTSMVFADPGSNTKVRIGAGADNVGQFGGVSIGNNANNGIGIGKSYVVGIGTTAKATKEAAVAIGVTSSANGAGSIALGARAKATSQGEMNIGTSVTSYGYNSSNYRLLTGLYDGQSAHDAATVAQGNTLSTSAPTTSTVGVLGQLYTDTTNMHTYQCTAISGDTYTWTQRW